MSPVQQKVRLAASRLDAQRRVSLLPWTMGIGGALALLAVIGPKLWYWDRPQWLSSWWNLSCLLFAIGIGLILAEIRIRWKRTAPLKAAIEIDRRLDLRERVSSSCNLPAELAESEVGRLIEQDAAKHLDGVDIKPSFPVRFPRSLAAIAMLFVAIAAIGWSIPDAETEIVEAEKEATSLVDSQTREVVAQELQATLEQAQELADRLELEEGDELAEALRAAMEAFESEEPLEREDALARMNDLKDLMERRARELGDSESIRDALEKLGDIKEGPADRFVEAMRSGDLEQANEALDSLTDALEEMTDPSASEEARQAAAEQLDQFAEQLKEQAQRAREQREELERRLERALQEGNNEEAAQLEQQLENSNDPQAVEELAEAIEQAAAAQQEAAEAQQQANEAQQQADAAQQEAEQAEAEAQQAEQAAEQAEQAAEAAENSPAEPGESEQQRQERIAEAQQQAANARQQAQQARQQAERAQQQAQQAEQQAQQAREQAEQAAQEAQQAMQQMQEDLQQAQAEMENLEDMEGVIENIEGARAQLRDANQPGQQAGQQQGRGQGRERGQNGRSRGQGRNQGQGEGRSQGQGQGQGSGMGEGQGTGERPESETDVEFFESQNRTTPQPGEVVIGGQVQGPNRPGTSNLSPREAVEQSLNTDTDPIGEQRLPRSRRNHVRGYFERFRDGG